MRYKNRLLTILKKEFNTTTDVLVKNHSESINHMIRCSIVAGLFADFLEFDNAEKERLMNCALLHDIGKIDINKNILYKKERLTDNEFNIIKSHVSYDYKCNDEAIKDSINYHHCCPFKKGYGWKGDMTYENIHLYAKIVSLLDVFDVLTHKRAYKDNTMEMAECISEIKECSGIQFDKYLCDKFVLFLEKVANENIISDEEEILYVI